MEKISWGDFFTELTEADRTAGIIKHEISKAIYMKRKELKLNQADFADYMGVTQGMVSRWESFEYNFTVESIAQIADKLKLKLEVSLNPIVESYRNIHCYKTSNDWLFNNKSYINTPPIGDVI